MQSRESTGYGRWKLRKRCCFTVHWMCIKGVWEGIFGYLYQPMGSRNDYAINGLTFVVGNWENHAASR